ncbi:MAG: hypothetical protein HYU33_05345 [Candidatus Omnitrophica bacterium]|nr:hypothetical protein [Candidatus Omnitrophota bacterium]
MESLSEEGMDWLTSNLAPAWYSAAGFGFSTLGGLLIYGLTNTMREGTKGRGWKTMIQGSVEQIMYTGSYLFGKPEFIAIWLGVKTAAQWQAWTRYKDDGGSFDKLLSPYLAGNGLSIVMAITGALMINWAQRHSALAWIVPSVVLMGIFIIRLWASLASSGRAEWVNKKIF